VEEGGVRGNDKWRENINGGRHFYIQIAFEWFGD
jgi:hypothetical protein